MHNIQYLWRPLSQCCALPALTERSPLSLRDISPFHGESPLSGEPNFPYLFVMENPLKTFRRNVFKISALQTGHRAERSCSLRPRKAVAFLTHLPRAPEARRREFRCLRTATQEAPRLLRTSRQLRSAGAAFSGKPFWNLLVSARCFLCSARRFQHCTKIFAIR